MSDSRLIPVRQVGEPRTVAARPTPAEQNAAAPGTFPAPLAQALLRFFSLKVER